MFVDTGRPGLCTRDSAGTTTALIGLDKMLHRPQQEDGASGIQSHCRSPEKPSNQKVVDTPGKRVHEGSDSDIRAETQQVPGLSVPRG